MPIADDEPVRKKPAHEIGHDLALLSVGEIEERIALLEAEIARLRTEAEAKGRTRSAADALFRL